MTGCGAVEIDFRFSKDGTLVCVHEWEDIGLEKKPKLKAFKKYKINGTYTTMTAEKALKRLAQTKIFLIIDTKEKDTAAVYREIDSILSSVNGGETYKKKLVPQIYSKEEYAVLKEIYAYKNWIFTLYKLKLKKADEYKDIAAFCKENKIKTVAIPKEDVTEKRVGYFTKKNIRVATHTVNDAEEWERLEAMGVKTFYTDFGKGDSN
ncbi:MAG: hypothetical protein K6G45_11185 [Lachnospiraceae bacterium]|nr:hypothetical protein [Lachnospiraceae bacterium]